ncbi:protein kinase domain-containing protein [Pseudofrankia sp. BMG5.37]|uniref:serine/threonine-protein kinase n=1 Tax=Pseudofrankia sp. BMG5.37 TaxID=3050035 RepID=UPI00289391EC|nr:protein kinase [Pseudofrankia sp. BMG5.37]MDT3440937.1 protein kinase [Pseudofrankia sp. BMG5.37]
MLKPLLPHDPMRIGQFALEGRLGAGGMGAVYLGRSLSGRAAVKVILSEYADNPAFREMFEHEVRLARRVAGIGTVRVLDSGNDAGRLYYATEFIDGPTLEEEIRRNGPMEPARLERLAVAVATALTAIHQARTVHLDLKPSNVLLSAEGPLVIDFGIARSFTTLDVARPKPGTPAFMAPEQARGNAAEPVGSATDIFAWGGLVIYAATGRPPFGDGSTRAQVYRVVHEVPDCAGVPEPLRSLVAAAMDKDPHRRPSATQLYGSLIATAGSRAVTGEEDDDRAASRLDAWPPMAELDRPRDVSGPVEAASPDGLAERQPELTPPPSGSDKVARGMGQEQPSSPVPSAAVTVSRPPRLGGREARGHGRPPRWLLALAGVVVLLAVTIMAVLLSASNGGTPDEKGAPGPGAAALTSGATPTATPTATATASQPSEEVWATTLADLDAARGRAFERVDESALADVYEVGSAVYAADLALLRQVASGGGHVPDLSYHFLDVQIREQIQDRVVLRVTYQLNAYEILDASGNVLVHQDQAAPEHVDITLVRTPAGWRISQRVPAS